MDSLMIFLSSFALVFVGELGDKTQIASGTGALANRRRATIIFWSSIAALVTVAGSTVFLAGLIPEGFVPTISVIGGILLIIYAIYLFIDAHQEKDESEEESGTNWALFISHFTIVFIAELGDKTQIATLAISVENQTNLWLVFYASSSALIAVTAITVWGASKIPASKIPLIQKLGALSMASYGVYMVL
tara:strand:+ start:1334 stop:1903 length:570 start_codon:yes stop_codon:yes gene_type:complete